MLDAAQLGIELLDLDDLLRTANAISIHLPKTPESLVLIGKVQLAGTGVDVLLRAAPADGAGISNADVVSQRMGGVEPEVSGVSSSVLGLILLVVWTAVTVLGAAARWLWTARA